jgi:hypothetical protein
MFLNEISILRLRGAVFFDGSASFELLISPTSENAKAGK